MTTNRLILASLTAMALASVGCSPNAPDSPGYYLVPQAQTAARAEDFMAAVGCRVTPKGKLGALAVVADSGRLLKFDCSQAGLAMGRVALRNWRAAVRAAGRRSFVQESPGGYWESTYLYSDPPRCSGWMYTGTTHDGVVRDADNGMWTDQWTDWYSPEGCVIVEHYSTRWVSDGGGGGGGSGGTAPPAIGLPPVDSVPLPADSACKGAADARPVSNAGVDFGPAAPNFGPLGSLNVQNDLAAAEAAARTSNGPERGGYILAQNGVYTVVPVQNTYAPGGALAGGSVCDDGMDGGMPSVASPAYVVAFWHTHPAAGTALSSDQCPRRQGDAVLGVSGPDRDVAMNSVTNPTTPGVSEYSNTNYVVQREANDGPIDFFRYGSNNGTYYASAVAQRSPASTTSCAAY